jgi:hypothetical protein
MVGYNLVIAKNSFYLPSCSCCFDVVAPFAVVIVVVVVVVVDKSVLYFMIFSRKSFLDGLSAAAFMLLLLSVLLLLLLLLLLTKYHFLVVDKNLLAFRNKICHDINQCMHQETHHIFLEYICTKDISKGKLKCLVNILYKVYIDIVPHNLENDGYVDKSG